MIKKLLLMFVFVSVASVGFAVEAYTFAKDSVGRSSSFADWDKKADVKINSVGGQLSIIANENIAQVDVYSAIGGLLYSAKINYSEARIDNLPKTFLVVRIKFANKKTVIYKIRHD
ncbi:hypothetical protein HW49_10965 [Porphyromonadaceae bacterium COT-184 OH4590]|nr:hypothetical protein HW49_10965 [Porphyromonadaceae bacterium COT-184 OH4590]